jgi:cation diffusion facilitator CzcD-associated flavoprotein CzcO
MTTTHLETVIVGAGQAGLSASYYLTQQRRDMSFSNKRMGLPMPGATTAGIPSR